MLHIQASTTIFDLQNSLLNSKVLKICSQPTVYPAILYHHFLFFPLAYTCTSMHMYISLLKGFVPQIYPTEKVPAELKPEDSLD